MIEMGSIPAEIQHIGLRSSTVRTRQGAEVIIPNSAFPDAGVILPFPRRHLRLLTHRKRQVRFLEPQDPANGAGLSSCSMLA